MPDNMQSFVSLWNALARVVVAATVIISITFLNAQSNNAPSIIFYLTISARFSYNSMLIYSNSHHSLLTHRRAERDRERCFCIFPNFED